MWSPTHVQVTVQRARDLPIKGKGGSNDCFVTIGLGKEKYQTSVRERSGPAVEWREECELPIPEGRSSVILTALHRNFVADQFLGQVSVPLEDLDVYETPKNRWYRLGNKPGKDDTKTRGDIELRFAFTVKEGSLNDLSKKEKHKSSMGQLSLAAQHVGGSLLSIGSLDKRKGLKKFAKKLGSKVNLHKKDKKTDALSTGSTNSINSKTVTINVPDTPSKQRVGESDPGVISEDEDEFAFDDLSHKSSGSSLNVGIPPRINKYAPSPNNASLENLGGGELLRRSTSSGIIPAEKTPPPKPVRLGLEDLSKSPKIDNSIKESDEWSQKLYSKNRVQSQLLIDKEKSATLGSNNKSVENINRQVTKEKNDSPKFFKKFSASKDKNKKSIEERIIIGQEGIIDEVKINPAYGKLPPEYIRENQSKTKEELVVQVFSLQNEVENQKRKVKDLENYLDELLLRVMETTPRILQNPYGKNHLMIKEK